MPVVSQRYMLGKEQTHMGPFLSCGQDLNIWKGQQFWAESLIPVSLVSEAEIYRVKKWSSPYLFPALSRLPSYDCRVFRETPSHSEPQCQHAGPLRRKGSTHVTHPLVLVVPPLFWEYYFLYPNKDGTELYWISKK